MASLSQAVNSLFLKEFVGAIQPLVTGPLPQQFLRMSSDLPAGR